MTNVFLLCAVIGGTVMVFQFVMTMLGIDGDADMDADLSNVTDSLGGSDAALDIGDPHSSTSVFGVLSFRTVIAAMAFFGLGGLSAQGFGMAAPVQIGLALVCGTGALFGVYYVMRAVYGLGQIGTLNINNAVGKTATVYIPIPAGKSGPGKVQVRVQDRLEEFSAVSAADHKLATGAKVVVVAVVGGNTLEVEPLRETAPA